MVCVNRLGFRVFGLAAACDAALEKDQADRAISTG
jgi:hypothetical protein